MFLPFVKAVSITPMPIKKTKTGQHYFKTGHIRWSQDLETLHCSFIFVAMTERRLQPVLCRSACICLWANTKLFQLSYITLQPSKHCNAGLGLQGNPPFIFFLQTSLQLPGGLSSMASFLTSLLWSPRVINISDVKHSNTVGLIGLPLPSKDQNR